MERQNANPLFRDKIISILKMGTTQDVINKVLDVNAMKLYTRAFTSKTANVHYNYEVLEHLGDLIANTCLGLYFSERFPHLFNHPQGQNILSRLKIKYVDSKSWALIAEKLGFFQFAIVNPDQKKECLDSKEKRQKLLEDIFEAFMGATNKIFDQKYMLGSGFIVIRKIIKGLLNDAYPVIELTRKSLYDSKTRLKEYFDASEVKLFFNNSIKNLQYRHNKETKSVQVYLVLLNAQPIKLGEGQGETSNETEKIAAEKSIENIKNYFTPQQGWPVDKREGVSFEV